MIELGNSVYERLGRYSEEIEKLEGKEMLDYITWLTFNHTENPEFRVEIDYKTKPKDIKVGKRFYFVRELGEVLFIEVTYIRSGVIFYKILTINDKPTGSDKEEVMFLGSIRAELMEPEEMDFEYNPKYYKPGVSLGKTKINYTYETKRDDNDRRS